MGTALTRLLGGIAAVLALGIWVTPGCTSKRVSGTGDEGQGAEAGRAADGGSGSTDPAGEGGNGEVGQVGGGQTSGNAGAMSGGTGGGGGSAGPAGGGPILCNANYKQVCVNPQTVQACNLQTGFVETIDCREDVPEGLANLGCDLASDGTQACLLDFADPTCWVGAQVFSVCAGATTDDEVIGFYLGCFRDMNGAHTIIPCYLDFVDEVTSTVDCAAADFECLGDFGAGGAGSGEGGAGGAPD